MGRRGVAIRTRPAFFLEPRREYWVGGDATAINACVRLLLDHPRG
jgi:hypothetical protein